METISQGLAKSLGQQPRQKDLDKVGDAKTSLRDTIAVANKHADHSDSISCVLPCAVSSLVRGAVSHPRAHPWLEMMISTP